MKFETKVKNYVNLLADFADNRSNRGKNILKLSMQYDKICQQWQEIIPDVLLNQMLDKDNEELENLAMHSIIDCSNAERVMMNVEHLIDLYEKFKDKKKLVDKILKG